MKLEKVDYYLQQGEKLQKEGRFEMAIEKYRVAASINPDLDFIWERLGDIFLYKCSQFNNAVLSYRRAISLNPNQSLLHFKLGYAAYLNGQMQEAEKFYKSSIQLNPDFEDAYFHLFRTFVNLKRFQESDNVLNWMLRRYPDKAINYLPSWEYLQDEWIDELDSKFQKYDTQEYIQQIRKGWNPSRLDSSLPVSLAGDVSVTNHRSHPDHNMIMIYSYVLARVSRQYDKMSILDWGGGPGGYYLLSKALVPGVEFDYFVKELPGICELGRELLPEVTWYDSDDRCFENKYDFVMAIGSLQYARDWKAVLTRLIRSSHRYLLVGRVPFVTTEKSFVVLQRFQRINNLSSKVISWFLNEHEMLDIITRENMKLVREFMYDESIFPYKAQEAGKLLGFLFEKE